MSDENGWGNRANVVFERVPTTGGEHFRRVVKRRFSLGSEPLDGRSCRKTKSKRASRFTNGRFSERPCNDGDRSRTAAVVGDGQCGRKINKRNGNNTEKYHTYRAQWTRATATSCYTANGVSTTIVRRTVRNGGRCREIRSTVQVNIRKNRMGHLAVITRRR